MIHYSGAFLSVGSTFCWISPCGDPAIFRAYRQKTRLSKVVLPWTKSMTSPYLARGDSAAIQKQFVLGLNHD